MRLLILCLGLLASHVTYASDFNCSYRDSVDDQAVAQLSFSNDEETLRFEDIQTGFVLNANLDELEDSSYFYTANADGVEYTVVVSVRLFEIGEANLWIEVDGEPIRDGLYSCKKSNQ